MRNRLSLLFASLLSFSLLAQTSNSDYSFTIHIGAFVKAHSSDFDEIKPYGFLYAQRMNNLLQVYMGDYSSEGEAMKVLDKVKRHSYPDAFITRRDLRNATDTRVIQLASKPVGESINWQHYATVGQLFVLLEGKQVKLLTGPFATVAESDAQLLKLKTAGFKDAFAKSANDALLHAVSEFEAGGALTPSNTTTLAVASETKAPPKEETRSSLFVVPPKAKEETTAPKEVEVFTAREATIPESYDRDEKRIETKPTGAESKPNTPGTTIAEKPAAKKTSVKTEVKKVPVPQTRPKVKRNSAYNLQLLMKQEGVYNNSLDGFYGANTKVAWEAVLKSNDQLKKYVLLTGIGEEMTERSTAPILQYYINDLNSNPEQSLSGLKTSEEAVAKTYRAYALFTQKGASKEVNELMNAAIKQAFANKKLENKSAFDHTVKFEYKSIDQLIIHLRYVQGAASEKVETPLWLFLKHPKESQAAFEPSTEFTDESYPIQDAMTLFDWPEFRLLETILKELNTNTKKQSDKSDQYLRSRLLLTPKVLSQSAHVSISNWNKDLWARMEKWGASDPLHGKFLTPLKLTYFQTLVRLEDYYMDKGFDSRTATALGLKVMKTFVAQPLASY
jgi:hypothetical protein